MNFKIFRPFIALLGLTLCTNYTAAQDTESHGSSALHVYYSDLNQTLSSYDLTDVPFQREQIKVKRGDSLLEIARQHRFRELDFYHLAAALYETNPQAFDNSDSSQLKIGATINLPTVGDLFIAQERYEKLKVVGEDLDFNNEENQMRKALRWPFGKSLVLIGPYAKDELPRNQEVTLTSYRPDAMSIKGNSTDFLSSASLASADQQTSSGRKNADQNTDKEIYSSWLDQSEQATPIAESLPLEDKADQEMTALSEPLQASAYAEAISEPVIDFSKLKADPVTVAVPKPKATPETVTVSKPKAEPKTVAALKSKATLETVAISEPTTEPETVAVAVSKPVAVPKTAAASEPKAESQKVAIARKEKVTTAIAAIEPAIAQETSLTTLHADNKSYLGPPRNSTVPSSNDIQTDPLSYTVEWSFDDSASVGTALNKLADYIGYELVSTDDVVLDTYTRQLPSMQLRVSGVSAEEGFAILAGRGLETVFDHVTRSVKHIPGKKRKLNSIASTPNSPVKNTANGTEIKTSTVSEIHAKFMQQTGISAMLKQFPTDIQNAANRHASRCNSTANTRTPGAEQLHNVIIGSLQQKTPEPVARNLVKWYDSPTGRKVLELERGDIDEAELKQFSVNANRVDRIQQIYNNTVTGKGIASIAIELDYSGWTLSGCKQKAEISGDVQKMNKEMIYGQGIKKKYVKLESILRGDMLRSMAYLFSSLSDQELTEYAAVTKENAGIYSELQQSIINAIAVETK